MNRKAITEAEAKVLLREIRQYFGQIGLEEVSPELESAWEQYRQAYLQRPQQRPEA